ncbi:MAG: N-acetylmuramoyl-L-alanine amidase [Armatimonadetes bacterium]|nr:N-acetylmuramoyl-L-alanine amidase [Armatimonadota bacterium]
METKITGKLSVFGGPHDKGAAPDHDLSFVSSEELEKLWPIVGEYFLPTQPRGTSGTARRLDPDSFYIACRWNYSEHPVENLRTMLVSVRDPLTGRSAMAKPIEWGPEIASGRIANLSPGLASYLGVSIDDVVEVTIPTASVDSQGGAVAVVKTIEYMYIQARNYLPGRSRPVQNIILHASNGSENDDLSYFTTSAVSAHWYITRTGKVYQFVDNADTAYHVGKAISTLYSNAATIGIEHEHFDPDPTVGRKANQDWPDEQVCATADLCAFLCQRYGLKLGNILTHAYVAEPHGRVSDPVGYPMKKFEDRLKESMQYTWVTQSVGMLNPV